MTETFLGLMIDRGWGKEPGWWESLSVGQRRVLMEFELVQMAMKHRRAAT